MTTAHDILKAAAGHMQDRAATYDKPEGERSMCATVEAFRAITGIRVTQEQGWLFMALLKAVRSQQGAYRADNYEDGAAYFALAGEAAARHRKRPVIRELYTEADEDRRGQIGTNGNEGTHYAQSLPAGYSWADAPPDATVLVMSTMTGAYHWADAFSDGARIYGAKFEQMGLTGSSGWKLIAHRPNSEPGWVPHEGGILPTNILARVRVVMRDGDTDVGIAGIFRWDHRGNGRDIVAYRLEPLPK